jgi:hypothetical protein
MSSPTDPALAGSLRVARVGEAVIPLEFIGPYGGAMVNFGMTALAVNAARTRQAVRFLCANANPDRLAGTDTLKMAIFEVAGGKSPEAAYETIKAMILDGMPIWKKTELPVLAPVDA